MLINTNRSWSRSLNGTSVNILSFPHIRLHSADICVLCRYLNAEHPLGPMGSGHGCIGRPHSCQVAVRRPLPAEPCSRPAAADKRPCLSWGWDAGCSAHQLAASAAGQVSHTSHLCTIWTCTSHPAAGLSRGTIRARAAGSDATSAEYLGSCDGGGTQHAWA